MRVQLKVSTALFFLCMLIILLYPIKTLLDTYDEGFAVLNATRILHGDIPYKDFWALYPPGQFYALAGIFKVFGANLLIARLYDTIVRFVIVIGVYQLANKIGSQTAALFAAFVTTLLLASVGIYTYAVFPSVALDLLSVLCSIKFVGTSQRRWLWGSGLLVGISSLFRWDIGLYAGASTVLALSIFYYGKQEDRSLSKLAQTLLRPLSVLIGAALLIIVPCYGYLIARSGFSEFWTQLIVIPTTTFRAVRGLPYPSIIPPFFGANEANLVNVYPSFLLWLQFYLPIAIYCVALVALIRAYLGKRLTFNTAFYSKTALLLLGMALFTQTLSRYDYSHVLPTTLIAFMFAIPPIQSRVARNRNFVVKCVAILAVTVLLTLYFLAYGLLAFGLSPLGCYAETERAGCILVIKDQDQALGYVQAHTSDGEAIYVGNQRHDLILINDVSFYFLADRPSATKYAELHPGIATTLPIQEEIVHEIESNKVNWIVLVDVPLSREPNGSSISSDVHFLDDFIRGNYALDAEFGTYQVWTKKP